ncbi:hypothetical protein CBW65_12295 [Tumebacillus avium]|uniref:Uncharacterized protein n=1 Tax=Tumebacillus avium TaxID=1903704 RepID=A0A1Y0IPG9_9BACL|nr:hypothetical protein [Tumebacillus avium]ARU61716.1 hypothetical protein CBW65_12295 [Tumebacillus avium]
MIRDMKRRAVEWQAKRDRVKRVVFGSGFVVLAVAATMIWNLATGTDMNWLAAAVIAIAGLGTFFFGLSAYANTMLVAMYYNACSHFLEKSEEMELITGTIEEVRHVRLPYIGQLYHVTINVAGQSTRYYFPGKLLEGLHPNDRIRVLTHDLFAVRVESTPST